MPRVVGQESRHGNPRNDVSTYHDFLSFQDGAQRSVQRRSRKDRSNQCLPHPGYETFSCCRPAESSGAQLSDRGDIELGRGTHSTMSLAQELSCDIHFAVGTQLKVTTPSKRPTPKKKNKRKSNSQKPPTIAPSGASADDQEPSNTRAMTPSNFPLSSKPLSAGQYDQTRGLLEFENQAEKEHKPKSNEQHREEADSSQPQPPLTASQSDTPSTVMGRLSPELLSDGRKHDEERISNDSTGPFQSSSVPERRRKKKIIGDRQTRKRLRRVSVSTPDGGPGEGSECTHDVSGPIVSGPSSREGIVVESKAQRKRSRPEFETGFVASHENVSDDPREPLGLDPREWRPLPRKVRGRHLAANDDTILHRDIGSNGPKSRVENWIQDDDVEYGSERGEDETSDVQVNPAGSGPMAIPKPPVPVSPRIWAWSRQEVCESLDYFRCYHSGVYSKDDIVRGYLLGAYAASRDIFHHDGKLIISHGGGKSESILECKGLKRYQTDSDQEASDRSVRALLRTHRDRRPIALLADDKYASFPYDLASANHTYVVLGLYWISHAWAERQLARDKTGFIIRWKFAFQWCEGQGDPWWTSHKMISEPSMSTLISGACPAYTGREPSIRCQICRGDSPFIYKQGWMCLKPHCPAFWRIDNHEPEQLDYREEFLTLLPQKFDKLPNLIPNTAVETPDGVTTTYASSRGWHCMKCGRLSCRYIWEHRECANCHSTQEVHSRIRLPKEFWHLRPTKGFEHSQIAKGSGILAHRPEPVNLGEHKGLVKRLTFVLPRDRGKIHLILSTPLTNEHADYIFQLYQQQASTGELKLRRYPLHTHKARGPLLANYFSQNSGEPYKYIGGSGNTVPFDEAPECVQRALALIKERSKIALGIDVPFNEILTAAYMERQKMSFHSDNEKGLGPIVASLSLGSAAMMLFRPHANAGDPKNSPYALSLVLRHGDILVMEGDGVQKYYEHTVLPMNFRIAATARCIGSS